MLCCVTCFAPLLGLQSCFRRWIRAHHVIRPPIASSRPLCPLSCASLTTSYCPFAGLDNYCDVLLVEL
jgi:hypothetical protein